MMPTQSLKRIVFLFVVLVSPILALTSQNAFGQASEVSTDPAVIAAGEALFTQNCKTCHNIQTKLIGPALKNVYDRRELPWIVSFVRNSSKMIASGDEQAVQVYNENNQVQMTAFDTFSDEEILSIVAYIKDQTDNPPAAAATPAAGDGTAAAQPAGIPAAYLNAIIIGGIVLLVALLIILFMIVGALSKYINLRDDVSEEDKEFVSQWNPMTLARNKAFIGIVVAIVTAVVAKGVIDNLYSIGVQQGYAPKQPIAYSHKVHAGDYQIDCNYCHTGVTKSKNANIPSPNICMNCHSSITTGTTTGTTEIDKIYAAIENDTPIEWVRVHNLPDLAYFNHQQHYDVGGITCQTCHGPIEEMEVVRQYSNLTMGWCINCHRDTEINTKGNAYYDDLLKMHEEASDKPFTVEANGGLDCAKCHY
jgi:mono/diheme cytochrome c family protein